jgi:hypothetical protein
MAKPLEYRGKTHRTQRTLAKPSENFGTTHRTHRSLTKLAENLRKHTEPTET